MVVRLIMNSTSQVFTDSTQNRHIIVIIIDRFYIALFSALEQTHCARMWFYMSE